MEENQMVSYSVGQGYKTAVPTLSRASMEEYKGRVYHRDNTGF